MLRIKAYAGGPRPPVDRAARDACPSERRCYHPGMRLITIPLSHYCERARWALDRCGASYHEDQHLQMFHLSQVRRAGGRHTVPLLVTPDGPLTDSAEIVAYADRQAVPERRLYPEDDGRRTEVLELERAYAGTFGVESRRWAYHRLLPHRRLLMK